MDIESTRFGTFQVLDDLVLTFPDGLIGLPGYGSNSLIRSFRVSLVMTRPCTISI